VLDIPLANVQVRGHFASIGIPLLHEGCKGDRAGAEVRGHLGRVTQPGGVEVCRPGRRRQPSAEPLCSTRMSKSVRR
jgi:hypothetical protein